MKLLALLESDERNALIVGLFRGFTDRKVPARPVIQNTNFKISIMRRIYLFILFVFHAMQR